MSLHGPFGIFRVVGGGRFTESRRPRPPPPADQPPDVPRPRIPLVHSGYHSGSRLLVTAASLGVELIRVLCVL
jgi:hypothetical protein